MKESAMKTLCACLVVLATVGGAQAPVPPTRSLGPVVATSQPLALVRDVRQLADGRVLVNDGGSRYDALFRRRRIGGARPRR
jgi:hypothetical protein